MWLINFFFDILRDSLPTQKKLALYIYLPFVYCGCVFTLSTPKGKLVQNLFLVYLEFYTLVLFFGLP